MMRIDDKSDAEVQELYTTARDAGIDFFDHADVYGKDLHGCEARFAEALQLTPAQREELRNKAEGEKRKFEMIKQ